MNALPATPYFSKRTLIEAVRQVIAELGVDDVLKPEWGKEASDDTDIEFYRDQSKLFWEMMEIILGELRNAPPERQKEWAYGNEWGSDIIQHIPQLLHMVDMKWIRSKLSDRSVYETIREYNLDPYSSHAMRRMAHIELPHLLSRYLF